MNLKRSMVIWIMFIIIVFLISKYHPQYISFGAMWAKYHLLHGGRVAFSSVEFDLPYNWWIASHEVNSITLLRFPPLGESFISLDEEALSLEKLNGYKQELIIEDERLYKVGNVEFMFIDNEFSYGLEYRVFCDCKNNNTILWIWAIPSKCLVIRCFHIGCKDKKVVLDEILTKIKFK